MLSYPAALIYLGFFGLIGFSLWITKEPLVLLALIFTPAIEEYDKKNDDEEEG
ncbi:hypothetical protein KAU33_16005 [Candidatus Dependentiae bacterium]|nr:hypothetical protein [Candidatus Dependentiae bacterium]